MTFNLREVLVKKHILISLKEKDENNNKKVDFINV